MFHPLLHLDEFWFSLYAILLLVTSATSLVYGTVIVYREQGSRTSWWFFVLTATLSWWLLGRGMMSASGDPQTALQWTHFSYAVFPFMPPAFVQFTFHAIGRERKPVLILVPLWTIAAAITIVSLTSREVVSGLIQYPWGFYPHYGRGGIVVIAYWGLCGIVNFGAIAREVRRLPRGKRRSRLLWFTTATVIGLVGTLDFVAAYDIPVLPIGHLGAFAWIVITGVAIRRFQFFDLTAAFAATNIVSTMQDGLIVTDDEQRVRIVNDALCRVSGFSRDELLALHSEELIASPDRSEATVRSRGGERIPVTLSVSPLEYQGRRVGTVIVAHDIRERLRIESAMLEQEMQLRTEQLQASLRRSEAMSTLGALVGGVAHEVRNPLFAISATLDAFERVHGARPELQSFLHVLRDQIVRLSDLMSGLLEFGRPAPHVLTSGPAEPLVREAIALCASEAQAHGVTIVAEFAAGLPLISLDGRRLVQAFRNVIHNAVQHSPAGGAVTVRLDGGTAPSGESVLVCRVTDEGQGFDAADIPHVFAPFFTHRRGGTGLGLSITRAVVEQHHGSIVAGNGAEGGAVVTIALPLAADAVRAPDAS